MHVNLVLLVVIQKTVAISPDSVLYKEIFTYHNETSFKTEFAYEVVQKIHKSFQQWFFTIIFCEFTFFENRILKYTETSNYGYPVFLLDGCPAKNKYKTKPRIDKHGKTSYIISSNELSTDVSEFTIQALLRTGVFKPRNPVIFVINVPVQIDSYFHYDMLIHFELLWSRGIPNSVLVLWSSKLRMYTYNPFLRVISEVPDRENVNLLLTRQYNNLYGHVLKVSVLRKVYLDNSPGPMTCNSYLAQTVIKNLNATCKPTPPRDGKSVGDLLENGTATGVIADLIEAYTDVELSSRILRNSFYGWVDTTYPFVEDELCFLVQKSGKQSTFKTTLKLISANVLILLLCNIVFVIVTSLVVRKVETIIWNLSDYRSSGEVAMDLIKCLIRQTVDITFVGPIFRFVVLIVILYSLVIDCAIDGILTSAITYPRYKPDLNTIDELGQTNLTIAVHDRNLDIFLSSLSPQIYETFKDRIETVDDQRIKEIIEEKNYKYALLLLKSETKVISRNPNNILNGRPQLHTMQECALPCWLVHAQRYGSPYLNKIDSILRSLHQGGILQYWVQKEEPYTKKTFIDVEGEQEKKPLKAENLQEVFIVLIVGMILSAIVLLFELFLHSVTKIIIIV